MIIGHWHNQYSTIQGCGGFDIAGVPFTLCTLCYTELNNNIYARMFANRLCKWILHQTTVSIDMLYTYFGIINE